MQRAVVVGASLAGVRASEALRAQGYDGELILIGAEPHAPYDRPPLSKQVLRGEWSAERTRLRFDPSALRIEMRLGVSATRLDTDAQLLSLSDGSTLRYDGLVIATGASARRPPWGQGLAGVHVVRTLDDSIALHAALAQRPTVCIIGAGFIGLEVASSCRALGLEVHVVEPLETPLSPKLGVRMGKLIEQMHRDAGVYLHTGIGVAAIEGHTRVERVRLSDGSAIEANVVVAGLGVTLNTEWLRGSGVALGHADGVECDATCATSVPNIVAAGDLARWPNAWLDPAMVGSSMGSSMRVEHWTHAVEQAAHAAKRLLNGPSFTEAFAPVPYFWSDQLGVKIQFAGHSAPGDDVIVVEGSEAERKLVALYGRAGRVMGVLALGRPAQLMQYRKRIAEGMRMDEVVSRS